MEDFIWIRHEPNAIVFRKRVFHLGVELMVMTRRVIILKTENGILTQNETSPGIETSFTIPRKQTCIGSRIRRRRLNIPQVAVPTTIKMVCVTKTRKWDALAPSHALGKNISRNCHQRVTTTSVVTRSIVWTMNVIRLNAESTVWTSWRIRGCAIRADVLIMAATMMKTVGVTSWTKSSVVWISAPVIMTVVWIPMPALVLLATFATSMPIVCQSNVLGVMERIDVHYLLKILTIDCLVIEILWPIWITLHVTMPIFVVCPMDVHINALCLIDNFHLWKGYLFQTQEIKHTSKWRRKIVKKWFVV